MPRLLQTANIRRGGFASALASLANAGRIASRSGSDRATPAPRRKLRRESGCREEVFVVIVAGLRCLLLGKDLALDYFVNQLSHAEPPGFLSREHLIDHLPV